MEIWLRNEPNRNATCVVNGLFLNTRKVGEFGLQIWPEFVEKERLKLNAFAAFANYGCNTDVEVSLTLCYDVDQ